MVCLWTGLWKINIAHTNNDDGGDDNNIYIEFLFVSGQYYIEQGCKIGRSLGSSYIGGFASKGGWAILNCWQTIWPSTCTNYYHFWVHGKRPSLYNEECVKSFCLTWHNTTKDKWRNYHQQMELNAEVWISLIKICQEMFLTLKIYSIIGHWNVNGLGRCTKVEKFIQI